MQGWSDVFFIFIFRNVWVCGEGQDVRRSDGGRAALIDISAAPQMAWRRRSRIGQPPNRRRGRGVFPHASGMVLTVMLPGNGRGWGCFMSN